MPILKDSDTYLGRYNEAINDVEGRLILSTASIYQIFRELFVRVLCGITPETIKDPYTREVIAELKSQGMQEKMNDMQRTIDEILEKVRELRL